MEKYKKDKWKLGKEKKLRIDDEVGKELEEIEAEERIERFWTQIYKTHQNKINEYWNQEKKTHETEMERIEEQDREDETNEDIPKIVLHPYKKSKSKQV